ncbi:hypothetical protein FNF28_02349 [Cafeteria roenbergensis]|uniref:Kri1-like C-terminal domain-containing protein n=1 Tax=Cafeteria roenbergensis TaxID=33653 RepID=A0A5A8DTM1_CAFRO|nr:hypothetical protein FNF28_02349 [Cafeteria roenbergensis]
MPRKSKASKDLFGGESDDEAAPKLRVNKQFAEHFDASRRRRDLARAREQGMLHEAERRIARMDGVAADDDDSDESSEDEGHVEPATDMRIMRVIQAIRNKDPKVYEDGVAWFKEDDALGKPDVDEAGHTRQRPADVIREQVVKAVREGRSDAFGDDDGPERPTGKGDGEDSDSGDEGTGNRLAAASEAAKRKVYNEEQAAMRQAFLEAVRESADAVAVAAEEEGGDWGGTLSLRKKSAAELARDAGEFEGFVQSVPTLTEEEREAATSFVKARPQDGADAFLKAYMLTRKWEEGSDDESDDGALLTVRDAADTGKVRGMEAARGEAPAEPSSGRRKRAMEEVDDDEDADALDAQDAFESQFNFRFEEEGGDKITGHPRVVEDTVRRQESKRKAQREARKARKEEERRAADEEARRLMNLRRAEMKGRLETIKHMAGDEVALARLASAVDLEGDFDPDAHDKQMQALFGDEYYGAGDADVATKGWETGERERPEWAGGEDGLDDKGVLGRKALRDKAEEKAQRKALKAAAKAIAAEEEGSDEDSDEGEAEGSDAEGEGEGEGEGATSGRGRGRKGKSSRSRKPGGRLMAEAAAALRDADGDIEAAANAAADEMGFDDIIAGGLRTRFKYRQVGGQDWGLTAEDILLATDDELNAYVGLKKLAPFREREWTVSEHQQHKALKALRRRIAARLEKEGLVEPTPAAAAPSASAKTGEEAGPKKRKRGSRRKRAREEDGDDADDSTAADAAPPSSSSSAAAAAGDGDGDGDGAAKASKEPKAKKQKRAKEPKASKKAREPAPRKEVELPTGATMDVKRLAAYGIDAAGLGPARKKKTRRSSKKSSS